MADGGRPEARALAVVPGFVFDPAGVAGYLQGKGAEAAMLRHASLPGISQFRIETDEQKAGLAARLADYEEIVLVTPSLTLIHAIACGDDTLFEAALLLRPLLWGREVAVLLDFPAPDFRRGTVLARLADDLDILEKMGVKIRSLLLKTVGTVREGLELVTENDVRDASKTEDRRICIKEGAIVTQLAWETARELGVSIER